MTHDPKLQKFKVIRFYDIYSVTSWLSQFLLSFQVELINKFTSLKFIYTIYRSY